MRKGEELEGIGPGEMDGNWKRNDEGGKWERKNWKGLGEVSDLLTKFEGKGELEGIMRGGNGENGSEIGNCRGKEKRRGGNMVGNRR